MHLAPLDIKDLEFAAIGALVLVPVLCFLVKDHIDAWKID